MNDWRTCPSCGKPHALAFSVDKATQVRTISCRYCPHRQITEPPKPKEKTPA